MKTNCGGGLKAPSCHYCYSKYGTRSCGGDCEYNPYIGRCEKSKCLVLSRKKSKYRHPKITETCENDKNNKIGDRYKRDKCRL